MDDRVPSIMRDFPLPSLFENLRRIGEDKFRGPCPFHGGDNMNGIGVEKYRGEWRWTCFTGDCGSGSAIDVVRRRDSCSFREALDILDGGYTGAEPVRADSGTVRSPAAGELLLICDACGGEHTTFAPRQYGNGLRRPFHSSTALLEAWCAGWEIAAGGIACVGPRCLERLDAR